MTSNKDIFNFLCSLAPLELQMDFDNSGFQLGHMQAEAKKVLLSLDLTDAVVDEAVSEGCSLIISHHPLFFSPIKSIVDDYQGRKILKLIENNIAVISMHTNLDIAAGGVNDCLLKLIGAEYESALDIDGCGRVGVLSSEMNFDAFLSLLKDRLQTKGLRYYCAGRPVKRVAVMGGSGGDAVLRAAELGCDTYVTADIKYHQFQLAEQLGINLVDADHFCTENPVIYELAQKIRVKFPKLHVNISKTHKQLISFI